MAAPQRIAGGTGAVDKSGIISLKIPWVVSTLEEAMTFIPPAAPLGLPLVDRSATEDAGDWLVTCSYQGATPATVAAAKSNGFNETFELDDSTAEQPIDTHPDFLSISKKYGWDADLKEFKKEITVEGKTVVNPLYGTTAYLDINPVWRKTSTAFTFPQNLLREVGCIDKPTGAILPPTLPDNREWLKRSLKAAWNGNIWSITEEWLASGRYKWSRDIYRVR